LPDQLAGQPSKTGIPEVFGSISEAAKLYGITRTHVDEFVGKNATKSLP